MATEADQENNGQEAGADPVDVAIRFADALARYPSGDVHQLPVEETTMPGREVIPRKGNEGDLPAAIRDDARRAEVVSVMVDYSRARLDDDGQCIVLRPPGQQPIIVSAFQAQQLLNDLPPAAQDAERARHATGHNDD
jgi:hypothetical protein